jgi:hypothetical protein
MDKQASASAGFVTFCLVAAVLAEAYFSVQVGILRMETACRA